MWLHLLQYCNVGISDRMTAREHTSHHAGAAANNFEFGVDPNLDPELALALRVSMEEERARQAAAAAAAAADPAAAAAGEAAVAAGAAASGSAAPAEAAAAADAVAAPSAAADGAVPMEEDEDALLQQALALSMQVCRLLHIKFCKGWTAARITVYCSQRIKASQEVVLLQMTIWLAGACATRCTSSPGGCANDG